MTRDYICALCELPFTTTWSDDEAQKEFAQNFPEQAADDQEIVCEDCYKLILRLRTQGQIP